MRQFLAKKMVKREPVLQFDCTLTFLRYVNFQLVILYIFLNYTFAVKAFQKVTHAREGEILAMTRN